MELKVENINSIFYFYKTMALYILYIYLLLVHKAAMKIIYMDLHRF